MEKLEEKTSENHDRCTNGIKKEIKPISLVWPENLTIIDLNNQKLSNFDENVKLPLKLETLKLSQNNLQVVPDAVLKHPNLKHLDISFNKLEYFDETPLCCHTIEHLNLANNHLLGPPYWVWSETPKSLTYLNLSNNVRISESFQHGYFEELLMYKTLVKHLIIFNCRLGNFREIFGTFCRATRLEIGAADFSCYSANFMDTVPSHGLDKCCDTTILYLSNLKIFAVNPTIDIYKNILEINLASNNISCLPDEFCNLETLEVCILSQNNLCCLPECIDKLKKLKHLHVDNNELYMVPKALRLLPDLMTLDLYNNFCYEVPEEVWKINEIDVAQNYFDEPMDMDYLDKRQRLRLTKNGRMDGKKPEYEKPESVFSKSSSDEDMLSSDDGALLQMQHFFSSLMNRNHVQNSNIEQKDKFAPLSSEEDWSSDEYWVPTGICKPSAPTEFAWTYFIKKKMSEGNFCPMDLHTVPVYKKVKYEKMCNPKVYCEVEGQFDVTDDDDS